MRTAKVSNLPSLSDYLAKGLRLVFVGINPGVYSATVGYYFATPRNRFWSAFNRSGLAEGEFRPEDDRLLLRQGIGFTDVVKRPTRSASDLNAADFHQGAIALKQKLLHYQPGVICFHGVTAYGAYMRYSEGIRERPFLGLQPMNIGNSRVFVVPNPSPANAATSLDALVSWYVKLKAVVEEAISDRS